ncbi:MAG: NAD(P)-dependent oxidoreductase [Planctomycetes bacterium]|nr:NAD(P)-dependent oxidoreductase [Planctomycetota bacterium]
MPLALITGASAGIGRATAVAFARQKWSVAIGARRVERLQRLVPELQGLGAPAVFAERLDVTEPDSVERFTTGLVEQLGVPDCLVNNAGLARGVERVEDGEGEAWREMIETNVVGVLSMTRRVLPRMIERGSGHVIMLGSIAGTMPYANGSVYSATKSAVASIARALRLETLGRGIRISSVDPGATNTEFSLVRFSGDAERADHVYDGLEPLTGEDVAECILFIATRPAHVNIERIDLLCTAQADPWHYSREEDA